MLKSFKKKRTNSKANIQLKKVVEKKRQAKAKREEVDEGSSSDISDSSDSDYEEILISNLKKFPLPKHASEKEELPKEPLPLKREVAKPQEVNHANHFTEPIIKSEPIKIEPKKKTKSKRVVIKKYYNYKSKEPKEPKVEAPKVEEPKVEVQRVNYLGFATDSKKNDSREHMSNRIFNW